MLQDINDKITRQVKITCPIRGELNINEKAKDGITWTEEYKRVECVKFLLSMGYLRELFDFEKDVMKVGNAGRNRVRADIVLYKNKTKQNIFLIVEVKRDNKKIDDAINYQLKPSCITNNTEYGIYYDGIENILFKSPDFDTKYSLLKLPKYNFNWEDKFLIFYNLQRIENITGILDKIDQIFHSSGLTKEKRYKELFKIVIAKYFDEKDKKETTNVLDFQISQNTAENIKRLYKQASSYYRSESIDDTLDLKDALIVNIVQILQDYTFIDSPQDIMQVFFMNFAPHFLKTELDQFYTPIEIVNFITSLLEIKNTTKIIDPAGGSGDFLIGCLKKNGNISESIYYYDVSPEAKEVAMLNMILNGDGRSNLKVLDSIENYNEGNNSFDLVITNPPFGNRTLFENKNILQNYTLYCKYKYKQLGILFIERAMNLLKDNGILCIVLPNGYLTNPNDRGIREYLLNYKIVAYVSLPEGAFKGADTGVKTGILIVKKEKIKQNYKIFTDVAENIGFDYKSKGLNKLYRKDRATGNFILDNDNQKQSLTDLPDINKKFKKLVYDTDTSGFEKENSDLKYDYIEFNDYKKDLILRAETNTSLYLQTIKNIKKNNYTTLENAIITNKNSFNKVMSKEYSYIDIGNIENGSYLLSNKLLGWELPNRAKQSVKKYDICISKLKGSLDKFCMIVNDDTDNIVLTNGCYKITIGDEKIRLSFYKFLFSKDYEIQMACLATGSIMLDVKDNDLKEKLVFPLLPDKELQEMKEFIKQQEFFIKLRNDIK
jgi:type I restriction enzyme M protein